MTLPLFSGRFASSIAPCRAAPEEIPTEMPSFFASSLAAAKASSPSALKISSYTFVFRTSGTKPAPIPWILCAPAFPSERTGESDGSRATILTAGFCAFRYSPVPVRVPPVPTPAIKISTFPSVSFQISGPVVALWTAGLAGFTNCPGMKLPGISAASSSAFAMAPFIPFAPSVRTISAP